MSVFSSSKTPGTVITPPFLEGYQYRYFRFLSHHCNFFQARRDVANVFTIPVSWRTRLLYVAVLCVSYILFNDVIFLATRRTARPFDCWYYYVTASDRSRPCFILFHVSMFILSVTSLSATLLVLSASCDAVSFGPSFFLGSNILYPKPRFQTSSSSSRTGVV